MDLTVYLKERITYYEDLLKQLRDYFDTGAAISHPDDLRTCIDFFLLDLLEDTVEATKLKLDSTAYTKEKIDTFIKMLESLRYSFRTYVELMLRVK